MGSTRTLTRIHAVAHLSIRIISSIRPRIVAAQRRDREGYHAMKFAHRWIRDATIVLLTGAIALAQGDVESPDQRVLHPLSSFSVVAQDAEDVLLRIPHGADVLIDVQAEESARGILFELPRGSDGPVEFYVNGELVDVQVRSPFVIYHRELLQPGAWTILAVPDEGYAAEVTYRIR